MNKNILSNIIKSILVYTIAVTIVIDNHSIWMSNPNMGRIDLYNYLLLVICAIGLLIILVANKRTMNIKRLLINTFFISIYFTVYLLLTKINWFLGIRLIVIVILFMWIINFDNFKKIPHILLAYKNIIIMIAVVSMLFWLFGSLLGLIKASSYFPSTWGNIYGEYNLVPSFYNLYFEPQKIILPLFGEIGRNSAIFTEGAMASLNFSLALLIETVNQHSKKSCKVILVLAIISTFSTTGYIFLVLLFFFSFFKSGSHVKIYKILLLIPLFIIAILVISYLLKQKSTYGLESTTVRTDDFKVGIYTWLQHPFLGSGLSNITNLKQNMGLWRIYNTGFSNSITEILAEGGIFLSFIYFYIFYKAWYKSFINRQFNSVIVITLTFYLFVTTIFTYQYVLISLLIWFANNKFSSGGNKWDNLI